MPNPSGMHILMVAHSFPRNEGDMAGSFLWRLAEGLVARGHSVRVIAPADRGNTGKGTLGNVQVRRVRYASPRRETLAYTGTMHESILSAAGLVTFLRLLRAMSGAVEDECRRTGVQVVHAHWWVPGGLAARMAERRGRAFVVTLHGTDVAMARRLPGGRHAMAYVLRQARTVTAVSSYLASEAAGALGVRREAIPVTPMPLLAPQSGDPDMPRHGAVFVGRLNRQKGVHVLLDAMAVLRRNGRLVDLTVVGDGPDRAELKAKARALGIPVLFTGHVPPEQVRGYLADKRVFVLPSVNEGLGLAAAEALTQGVPVVASKSGGIPDLITDPDAGILVPPDDPDLLARAIQEVITQDRFRNGAVRAGAKLAQRLSTESVAERFEAIYQKARGTRQSLAGARA